MSFKGKLHPYQQEGYDAVMARGRALLAYEVGLGKTPTSLAIAEALMEEETILEPGLVFTFSSLKYQWGKSIEKFTDSGHIVIDGTPAQRLAQYEQVRQWRTSGIDYVILNYENLVNDFKHIEKLPRGFMILDECTAVKSHESARHKLTKALSVDVDVRIGLSGTPMTNGDPIEVFNQLAIIDPTVLGNFFRFEKRHIVRNEYGWVERYDNLPELHRKLKPVMISKKQDDPDVAPFLPETIYKEPTLVPLDRAGKTLYKRITKELLADLDEAVELLGNSFSLLEGSDPKKKGYSREDELKGQIASKVSALRMLCSHPALLQKSADEYDAKSGTGSKYLSGLAADGALKSLKRAPKLEALVKYVSDFLDADPHNKVVVFSSFVPTVDYIQQALKHGSVTHTGAMNAKAKEAARVQFQTDADTRVFISSDAGGFGLDLPEANLLINYDLPWASGTANQRNGRIRRASSTWKTVVIQNLLVEGSLEERQWEMLQQKNRIEAAVIEGKGINKQGGVKMNVASLRAFLREHTV